jgi:hypothetical protein
VVAGRQVRHDEVIALDGSVPGHPCSDRRRIMELHAHRLVLPARGLLRQVH